METSLTYFAFIHEINLLNLKIPLTNLKVTEEFHKP